MQLLSLILKKTYREKPEVEEEDDHYCRKATADEKDAGELTLSLKCFGMELVSLNDLK